MAKPAVRQPRPVGLAKAGAADDVRSSRPYFLSRSSLRSMAHRVISVLVLALIDISGLTIGLYLALAIRAALIDPRPVLWGLLWDQEVNWLPFLILILALVFWQARLYAPREAREGAGRVAPGVFLVAAISVAFAVGTGQQVTTFGLYVLAAVLVASLVALFRASYEAATGTLLRAAGVRRRVVLVGGDEQCRRLREMLGSSRGGIDYEFVGELSSQSEVEQALEDLTFHELIVADSDIEEARLLDIVDESNRQGVRVRIAPRTTDLLVERGEYVPGHGVPLFELRSPIFAGTQWALKRSFDLVVSLGILGIGLPLWGLIALVIKVTSRGPVLYADARAGLSEREFRMLKFRTMVTDAAERQERLEGANEASGALFKIRDDPRITRFGRFLRRYSLDEIPNVVNVLRGEMSLVGPRPLPLRDYALLEPWHLRRYNVLPGMTGLWQIAGRSDLSFDDLVRLDFYYLENWSIWLDIAILVKTPLAVFARKGAY